MKLNRYELILMDIMKLWFMVLITIVTGAYKPTYNWGASHCSCEYPIVVKIIQ